jgi:hypothetical protein
MARQQPRQTSDKKPTTRAPAPTGAARKPQTGAAGISNRPPVEEENEQAELPPRGQAKKPTPGGHA